jgi:subtilisin family serine protease
MRSVVWPVAAGLVVLLAAPAAAEPAPDPALPSLPRSLTADLTPAESARLATLTAGTGVSVDAFVQTPDGPTVVTLDAASASAAGQAAALLDAQPSVDGAGLTRTVHADGDRAGLGAVVAQNAVHQWDLPRIHAAAARSMVAASLGTVTVAVLDTGIAANPQLTPYLVAGRNFSDSDPTDPTDTADRDFHGTHVAGTIGASVQDYGVEGVAAGVRLMPVKVLDDNGDGYTSDIADGIVWAADHGADVLNMSLGGPNDDPTMQSAIDYARGKGVVVVAAVGNEAMENNPVEYPGASAGVIGVAATNDLDQRAGFSEYGAQVDIAAPGVDIQSLYLTSGIVSASGTSMATPHVAAVAAQLKAIEHAFTPDQVQNLVTSTAVDVGSPGRDDLTGAGRVDALAAVTAGFTAAGGTAPADHAPVTTPDSLTVTAGSYVSVDAKANDSDPDGDPLTYAGVTQPRRGWFVSVDGDGTLTYVGNYVGSDTFTYTVSDGRGLTSTETVTVTVTPQSTMPGPQEFTAAPDDGRVTLAWSPVANASGYRVNRDGAPLLDVPDAGYTDRSVTNGTAYTYQVTALDSVGATGGYTNSVSAVPHVLPPPLTAPTGVTVSTSVGRAAVTWNAVNGAVSYRLYRDGSYVGSIPGLSLEDTGASPGSHAWRVAAVDAAGNDGPLSSAVSAIVPAPSPIQVLYDRLGGSSSALGPPMSAEYSLAGGTVRNFLFGWILLAPGSSTAHYANGAINAQYVALGGPSGGLGFPTSDPSGPMQGGGWGQHFQGGTIFWSPATGAHAVTGGYRDKWAAQGWEAGTLGYPTSDTICGMRNGGCGQHFQGGTIFSSWSTDPHAVTGAYRDKWASFGWEAGALGYPISDLSGPMRGGGRGQQFQGGSIYFSPATGLHAVYGAYRDKWAAQGWEAGGLGYPTSDESGPMRGGGHGQQFQGGSIFWTPAAGAHPVSGPIRDRWGAMGWEAGALGYPISDGSGPMRNGGWGQAFQGGTIYWTPATGAHAVSGPVRDQWGRLGWENGRLGYPASEPYGVTGGTAQNFQGGTITLKSGRFTVTYRR